MGGVVQAVPQTALGMWFLSCKYFCFFLCQGTVFTCDPQVVWEEPGFGGRLPSGDSAAWSGNTPWKTGEAQSGGTGGPVRRAVPRRRFE